MSDWLMIDGVAVNFSKIEFIRFNWDEEKVEINFSSGRTHTVSLVKYMEAVEKFNDYWWGRS